MSVGGAEGELKDCEKFWAESDSVCFSLSVFCGCSGLHQSLPPGERHLRGQEEDQVSQEVPGPSLQPGPGIF